MRPRHALTAVTTLLAALAAVAPAAAAERDSAPAPLGTHLAYRTTTWTSQGEDMSIQAPRGWDFVLTPEGQARFNAGTRPDLLAMQYRGRGALRPQLDAKLVALRGTPGLRVLRATAHGRGEAANGELRYLWTPSGGATRFVAYRYVGDDAYVVAGPVADRRGLLRVLDTAALTGQCGGGA